MRLDQLRVELRPRTPWEAMELGTALVRRHAAAIWRPWLLLTLPAFALLNAAGWALDRLWLASLAMWWLKPVFDRIPLYVVSRAVFGDAPGTRDTLAAQWRWGWKPMPGYLSWRRLGPARALYLPIDLLEGGPRPARRRRVVGGGVRGNAVLLTVACMHFELALVFAAYALAMLFVPVELLTESARAAWALLSENPPRWVQLLGNLALWLATSVIEPFYVGAGFGLYLDRRTRIEAWDVEIAFRRLRARLRGLTVALLCACALVVALPGMAQDADDGQDAKAEAHAPDEKPDKPHVTLEQVFGQVDGEPGFGKAVERAWKDPLLSPSRDVTDWVPRDPKEAKKPKQTDSALLQGIATALGFVGEYGLWLLVLVLAVVVLLTRATWLPWLRAMARPVAAPPTPVESEAHVDADALPDDIAAAVRALWAEGRRRRALALLYRASVAAMAARTGAVLLPGATEAECLRAARHLADGEDRAAFARMVRAWQYAAYAGRLPEAGEFDALLAQLGARFGWTP